MSPWNQQEDKKFVWVFDDQIDFFLTLMNTSNGKYFNGSISYQEKPRKMPSGGQLFFMSF